MELNYSSVVSSALEAIKWQATKHRSVVMTMSTIKKRGVLLFMDNALRER